MNAPSSVTVPDTLIQVLREARSITVLTGAGISAESGIPTFRDSQTGLWAQYDPHQLATPEAFHQNPTLVMDWYRWRRSLVSQSAPNAGHLALAQMEAALQRENHAFHLITQNVDGLHAQAGSRRLIELHGSLQRLRCANDSSHYQTTQWGEDGSQPQCPTCDAHLRPDVVWFGEPLPAQALEDALRAARACDVFFSIGTSGVVEPAASLAYEALRAGATLVEINPQPTPLSVHARFYFPQPAGVALPKIVQAVWAE